MSFVPSNCTHFVSIQLSLGTAEKMKYSLNFYIFRYFIGRLPMPLPNDTMTLDCAGRKVELGSTFLAEGGGFF